MTAHCSLERCLLDHSGRIVSTQNEIARCRSDWSAEIATSYSHRAHLQHANWNVLDTYFLRHSFHWWWWWWEQRSALVVIWFVNHRLCLIELQSRIFICMRRTIHFSLTRHTHTPHGRWMYFNIFIYRTWNRFRKLLFGMLSAESVVNDIRHIWEWEWLVDFLCRPHIVVIFWRDTPLVIHHSSFVIIIYCERPQSQASAVRKRMS